MESPDQKLYFAPDYMEGAHPRVLQALVETNMVSVPGYGSDRFCEDARGRILGACACPNGEVHFVGGGTQANQVVIDALLEPWQGVVAAATGHVNVHEAGAIEATGHKVLALPSSEGKLAASDVRECWDAWHEDGNWEHMVEPGAVYLSQPTEYGTLYSLAELEGISAVCRQTGMKLFVDGARLAYDLACTGNDVSLPDLARLADAFYIGGTKCGALCGEAVVFPRAGTAPRFFTRIKRHGALFAKGRLLGVQFGALFTDGLYFELGRVAVESAERIRTALHDKGYRIYIESPTNQTFFVVGDARMEELAEHVVFAFDRKLDDAHTVIRLCTSWATRPEDVDALLGLL
ncbi:threonine aldolase family protein [Curtanaerobium respiraculi]|uniref:threonine aldolase family protein n=1 Tax=Curtanaerobium respiraculi TaxID=2949669 RepID=UPI0024B3507B|nr:beta-eliminating lyase-related protein [Curtanaerobium respiraculi]